MAQQAISLQEALTAHYPFHATAAEGGGWYVYFPDLPGCTTFADTWEELAHSAQAAVTSWLTIEDERGHSLPAPTLSGESTWQPHDFLVTSSQTPSERARELLRERDVLLRHARRIQELREWVADYEHRYGIPSADLHDAIERGDLTETDEVCDWIIKYESLLQAQSTEA